MSHLAPLIADLALILICAGIMTLLFKKLKQPLVLGYVVAGFLASPHMAYTPSVMDTANIQTWADIGVIFLLFALGLEFSFKKIVKVGGAAIIAACTIIFCMILLGVAVGTGFGWQRMDCIFLGGMIAMSSTTIIYKAFDDLGMRKKQFTGLVLSVLILEDILAIVLMVMLSTMAVSHNFEGTEMLGSIAKLLFFLILWFVVGIYLIPRIAEAVPEADERGNLADSLSRTLFRHGGDGCTYGVLGCFWCLHHGFHSCRNGRGREHRTAGEAGQGLVWRHLLRIGRHDGRPSHDCGVCGTYCRDYFSGYPRAIPFRDAGCAAGGATAKDSHAVRFQLDANR